MGRNWTALAAAAAALPTREREQSREEMDNTQHTLSEF